MKRQSGLQQQSLRNFRGRYSFGKNFIVRKYRFSQKKTSYTIEQV